jgi:hypothetical protein
MGTDLFRALAEVPDPFGGAVGTRLPPAPDLAHVASPTRDRVRTMRALALGGALTCEGIGIAVLKARPDLHSTSAIAIGLELAIPLAVALVALGALMRPGSLGLGLPAPRVALLVVGLPIFFALSTLALSPPDGDSSDFWFRALRCAAITAVLASVPLALGAMVLRRAFVSASGWRMAALGVACGALGAVAIGLVCPFSGALHVTLGHGAMMVVMGLGGGALGRWVGKA